MRMRLFTVFLVILAWAAMALVVSGSQDLKGILIEGVKTGLELSINKGCGASYQHGEYLDITVKSQRDGYLTIFDFSPSQKVQIIFPNVYHQDNFVKAGQEYRIPGNLPFRFLIAPPDGEEILFAVITEDDRRMAPEDVYNFEEDFPQLPDTPMKAATQIMKGINVIPTGTWWAGAMCHFNVGENATLGTGWALFVAVDDYDETVFTGDDGNSYSFPKLRYCVKGAREMAEALQPMYPHQKMLLDHQVTHEGVYTAITNWLAQAPEDATALIYYSGHGSRTPDQNNDEIDDYDETLVPWDYGSKRQFIIDDELHRWLSLLNANQVVMIFDSCHSGTMERGVFTANLVPGQKAAAPEPKLIDGMDADFSGPQGTKGTWWKQLIITACRARESAAESPVLKDGILTYYLLEALQGKGDVNNDGLVTAQEAYRYAAELVALANPRQHPQLTDKIEIPVPLAQEE